jgi:polyisoprenoid-binding protein YceI
LIKPVLLLMVFIALPCAAVHAQKVDYSKSEITFVAKQLGVPLDGRFRKFAAQIAFDPARPAEAKASIEVELSSIDTGLPEGDAEVTKRTWFNVAAFPMAKFQSTSVKKTGPDRYEVKGALSIKGISNEVMALVTVKQAGKTRTFEGGFSLFRLRYKIGEGIWADTETVADEVPVRFRIVTTEN